MPLNPEPILLLPSKILYDQIISTSIMHPLEGNANEVNRKTQKAIGESIQLYGFLEQFVVEPHPDIPGEYRILGGNHRYLEVQGDTRCNVVFGLTDAQAKKLSLALNTHGNPNAQMLASMLGEIYEVEGADAAIGIPYTPDEIEKIVNQPLPPITNEEETWKKITLDVPDGIYQVLMQAVEKTGIAHKSPSKRIVNALELICVEYIFSQHATTVETSL
ncbi:hypothetical protein [Pseudanabaena sp. 'Roaring Creek']|uniref:hypothetical protein n=1 Tax=Pseudanabaena sp. 'Roaring Creek' TaxID=1681830 RepID=UPI0006D79B59|nr:hypothetical protein [Pseudanabaena sp. 'Roaring Creek']